MTYRNCGRAALALALAMLLLFSVSGPLAACAEDSEARAEITVSTVDELLAAIAPNTSILLQPGVYDLAAASDYGRSYNYGYYSWNDAYDGYELVVRGADNLTISGAGGETVLNAEPRYAEVLRFEDCRNLTLSALTLGHTQEPGFCAGGVVEFDACAEVSVQDCRLYGCGVLGVTAQNCDGVRVESSAIYECSNGAVWVSGSRDFRMTDCEVYDCPGRENTAGYNLFEVQSSTGFAVVNSRVHGNVGQRLLRMSSADEVYFLGNEVSGNRFEILFETNRIAPVVEGCALSGNLYNEVFTGVDALRSFSGESLSAADLESMALAAQSYEGPRPRETAAVTGIPAQDGTEYHVTTVDELLSCIGPDTTVYLDAETFRWSDAANYGGYGGEYYYWLDAYDGPGLVITGVRNFRLIGQGKGETTLLAEPRYADVIQFQGCENVTVAQLTAGHTTEPSYCMGDVLAFESCEDVHVVDCGLFGCGVWGIRASNCVQGDVLRTEIYECSEGAVLMYWTTGFVFTDCSVHDCAGYAWNDADTKTAHNYMSLADCGDIVYNGAPIPGSGTYVIGDGEALMSAYGEYYDEPYTPRTTLHLFYYNIEVSQGFTLFVGDEVALDAVPGAYVDGQDFVWGVDNAAKLGLTVSESGHSCKLKALSPTQGAVTLTISYDDATLCVPVYIRA